MLAMVFLTNLIDSIEASLGRHELEDVVDG